MDIRMARKSKGISQHQLARLTGLEQGNLSKMEAGKISVSKKVAKKLAGVLDVSPIAIKMGNRAKAVERAMDNGDPVGVLKATEAIVKMADDLPEDPKLDAMLDRLVDTAVKFAEDAGSVVSEEDYDLDPDEKRDVLGRKVTKSSSTVSDNEDAYPLWKGHRGPGRTTDRYNDFDETQGYDDFDEGRDIYGIRIQPIGPVEED